MNIGAVQPDLSIASPVRDTFAAQAAVSESIIALLRLREGSELDAIGARAISEVSRRLEVLVDWSPTTPEATTALATLVSVGTTFESDTVARLQERLRALRVQVNALAEAQRLSGTDDGINVAITELRLLRDGLRDLPPLSPDVATNREF